MKPPENMKLWSYYMAYTCIWDKHLIERMSSLVQKETMENFASIYTKQKGKKKLIK
jgi:hypothetical protein